jgi:glutathione S-transferase
MALTLIIGNKNYSSWSLRPWLALAHCRVPFQEVQIPIGTPETQEAIRRYSPAGKVPILIDGDSTIWESYAILEHINERFPETRLWPRDPQARAHARAVACEMHGGFAALRNHCPMNLKRKRKRPLTPDVQKDVDRITAIWRDARGRFGEGGDFLFGAFSAADCMYAPVATRFASYGIDVDTVSAAYIETIYAMPAFQEWRKAALAETLSHPTTDAVP